MAVGQTLVHGQDALKHVEQEHRLELGLVHCTNPAPQHGGADCTGDTEETRDCNTEPCPSKLMIIKYLLIGNWIVGSNSSRRRRTA